MALLRRLVLAAIFFAAIFTANAQTTSARIDTSFALGFNWCWLPYWPGAWQPTADSTESLLREMHMNLQHVNIPTSVHSSAGYMGMDTLAAMMRRLNSMLLLQDEAPDANGIPVLSNATRLCLHETI